MGLRGGINRWVKTGGSPPNELSGWRINFQCNLTGA